MVFRHLLKLLKDNSHTRTKFDVQKCGNKFVIGAGFGRTGTTSLQVALQQLGFNSYHSTTVSDNPEDSPLWLKAVNMKKSKLNHNNVTSFNEWYTPQCKLNEFNWDEIFQTTTTQKYNASVGAPSVAFFMDILQFYENAPYNYDVKVIFTQRKDANVWCNSFMGSIGKMHNIVNKNWFLKRVASMGGIKIIQATFPELVLQQNMNKGFDEEIMKEKYIEWNKAVIENISSDKLLCFDVRDGWGPLCQFLNVDVPDTEFPRSNETKDMERISKIARVIGICANGMVVIVFVKVFLYLMDLSGVKETEMKVTVA
eukprot:129866_1